jgi:hypothetical protein
MARNWRAMASLAARRSIYELAALVWLATEVLRFVRARIEATSRGRVPTPVKERFRWKR